MSTTSLLTFAEFELLPDAPGKSELIDGEVIVSPPPKRRHSRIAQKCEDLLLTNFKRDCVFVEAGFKIGDHYSLPDVSLTASDQPDDNGYSAGAPVLAIEILSPANTAATIQRKIELYLTNPVRRSTEVWLVDDKRQSVTVYSLTESTIAMEQHTGPFISRHKNLTVNPAALFE